MIAICWGDTLDFLLTQVKLELPTYKRHLSVDVSEVPHELEKGVPISGSMTSILNPDGKLPYVEVGCNSKHSYRGVPSILL